MSFLNSIAAFKGAFLGTLVGNKLPCNDIGTARPQRPVYGQSSHYQSYSNQPADCHPQPARPSYAKPQPQTYPICEPVDCHSHTAQPGYAKPHPQPQTQPYPICEQPVPYRPLCPLYR